MLSGPWQRVGPPFRGELKLHIPPHIFHREMIPPLICPTCKGRFFPKQQWMHDKCKVVLMVEPATNTVANTETVANERVANRHGVYKNKEARLEYMRNLMRKKRDAARTGN